MGLIRKKLEIVSHCLHWSLVRVVRLGPRRKTRTSTLAWNAKKADAYIYIKGSKFTLQCHANLFGYLAEVYPNDEDHLCTFFLSSWSMHFTEQLSSFVSSEAPLAKLFRLPVNTKTISSQHQIDTRLLNFDSREQFLSLFSFKLTNTCRGDLLSRGVQLWLLLYWQLCKVST